MKTAEEIIEFLEAELAEAYELHDMTRGKDAAQAFSFLIKATTIEQLLDEIKEGQSTMDQVKMFAQSTK